jgi:hypothetical protein
VVVREGLEIRVRAKVLSVSLASPKVVNTLGVNQTAEFESRSVPIMTVSSFSWAVAMGG